MTGPVPENSWKQIVEHSPLVSVDLVVEYDDSVVLGKRENKPARGRWFVPGGVVRKGERLSDAVHRVAKVELGCDVSICTRLGVYEHFYEGSEFSEVSKHYVPIGFVVRPESESFEPNTQHESLKLFEPPFSGFHEYVQAYLDDYAEWKS